FRNLEKSNSWGSDFTNQLKLSPRLSVLTNASVFRLVTDGGSVTSVGSDALGWMARINLNADITKSLGVQANYNYRSSMKIERGEISAQQMMNISFRQKIQDDKGVLMLRISDPFRLMKFHIQTGDDNLMQITERTPNMRAVFLGYQYNFGRPPRVRQVAPDQTSGGSVGFGG
ncbi:MAG: outer membrane beta-barrel protein, partial [Gemmatimonadota bacterium]